MSDPTINNSTASALNNTIVSAGNSLIEATETMILADVPWLGLPVIKQLWEALFKWISGYFIRTAEKGATFAVIDIETDIEVNKLSSALQALIAAEKTGDNNAIKAAIQNYANAQSALAHSDGSAPIQ